MDDKLKFYKNDRMRRSQEIRRKNKKKRKIWTGILLAIIIAVSLFKLDGKGYFDGKFEKNLSYKGEKEYEDLAKESIYRKDIQKISQILINHPYGVNRDLPVKGIPTKSIDAGYFVDWVYYNLSDTILSEKSDLETNRISKIWDVSESIMEDELKIGDLGFEIVPDGNKANHLGIYIGEIDGMNVFIHSGGVEYGANGVEEGRVVVSINNRLKKNNYDTYGNKFTPAAESSSFVYYRRPDIEIKD
ncbi:MAG: hypothetical protein GX752_05500 [Clostridium sp.]|nr:hypothetical protein [Clostridium sp.]